MFKEICFNKYYCVCGLIKNIINILQIIKTSLLNPVREAWDKNSSNSFAIAFTSSSNFLHVSSPNGEKSPYREKSRTP